MKYEAMLFDLDFSLYDECKYLNEAVISSQLFADTEKLINNITYRFRINSQNIINNLLNLENQLTKENSNYLFHIMKVINVELSCYDGIEEMLNELKNNSSIKTCLVTNGVPEIQKNKLRCLSIESCFDQTIFAKELGSEKPYYLPYEIALGRIEIDPKLALYVGDHPLNDIKPANELGMDTLWIDHLDEDNIDSTYRIIDPNYLAQKINNL